MKIVVILRMLRMMIYFEVIRKDFLGEMTVSKNISIQLTAKGFVIKDGKSSIELHEVGKAICSRASYDGWLCSSFVSCRAELELRNLFDKVVKTLKMRANRDEADRLLLDEEAKALSQGWDGHLASMPSEVRAAKELFEETFVQ